MVVQSPSSVQLFWDPMDCIMAGFPHHLLELAQIKSVMPSNNLILCCIGSIKKKTALIYKDIIETIDCSTRAIPGVSYLRII